MKIEIYCDESRHDLLANQQRVTVNNRYTVIGGIWLESSIRENLKTNIKVLKEKYHTYGEIKWNNVSDSRLDFYKSLIELFFNYSLDLKFRAIVIDALTVDLDKFHYSDAELGFYKFYYQLLFHWINTTNIYYIFTDYKRNRKNNRILELKEIINSAKHCSIIKHIQAIGSKESLILQLEDLIMGAVGYKYNFGYNGKSRAKMDIVKCIENKLARPIANTNKNEQKFNIFEHAFYESSNYRGNKDIFSHKRAERVDWIEFVLKDSNAELYVGYNKNKSYDNSRRVAIINQDDYLVVIQLTRGNRARFITAFMADSPYTARKIRGGRKWT